MNTLTYSIYYWALCGGYVNKVCVLIEGPYKGELVNDVENSCFGGERLPVEEYLDRVARGELDG